MAYLKQYKYLNRLIENESFEPVISWGFRMALAGTLPMLWGLATHRLDDAIWVTITAEAISWVELKGSFAWRVRTLLYGAILAFIFSVLGALTGFNIWLSVVCMFAVGYLSTVLKEIGDRASGLAICVYLLFIVSNAFPVSDYAAVRHRFLMIAIGAAWPVAVGLVASMFVPKEEPFRRQIALIWRAIALLIDAVAKNDKEDVYAKENDVRAAMNTSFEFYSRMVHQMNKKDNQQYQLGQVRKAAGLVSVNVIAMSEEMGHIAIGGLDESLRVKAATLYSAMKEAVSRISIFVITLKPEEQLLAVSHINRMKKLAALIREYPLPEHESVPIKRILQLADRTVNLLESAIQRIEQMGRDKPVIRSYSFVKTLFVLRPKYFFSSLRVLFSYDTFTTRYAVRSAVAATIGLFVFKWFHIEYGYWIPFSVMIIIQPYFGATLKRAVDRVVGTLLGGLAGSLLLQVPTDLHIKEGILFLTFLLMVYYLRKHYAVSAFFITLNLVLLFNIEAAYNNGVMILRALCTIGGAGLAVISGFVLLPTWDRKWLPRHLARAIKSNYAYFTATFYEQVKLQNWIRNKRSAESENSNVFDSFQRYMNDPGKEKSEVYYDIITNNMRITRNLNNIHLEQDEKSATHNGMATPTQQARINECLESFNKVLQQLPLLDGQLPVQPVVPGAGFFSPFRLNDAQVISLEKLIIELETLKADMDKLTVVMSDAGK